MNKWVMAKLGKIVERYKNDKIFLLLDLILFGCVIKIFIIIAVE